VRVVTVFGSSSVREGTPEWMEAYELGKEIAKAGLVLCNGGFGGTMEAACRGAKEMGGKTIGIITSFVDADKPNPYLDEVIYVPTYLERIERLIERGDAYVVLKGSVGTFSEFFLLWCLIYIGRVERKPVVLMGRGWRRVMEVIREEMLVTDTQFDLLSFAETPKEAVRLILSRL